MPFAIRTLTRLTLAATLILAGAAPARAEESMPASDAHVTRMGRTVTEADGAVRFSYPGVTLSVAFDGTRLAMDAEGGDRSLLDVVVDGGAPTTIHLGQGQRSIELAQGLAAGYHTVDIVHRTETWLGTVSVARFTTDGGFDPAPALSKRRLLVLGDSVTCGANMERPDQDKNNPLWWNAGASYGLLLGRELQAQTQLVCYGGRGLVRSWNGHTDDLNLPDYYRLAIPDAAHPVWWNQAAFVPDLILVAIGTNDFTQGIPDRGLYVASYEAFVRTLLRDHPGAQIALTEGAILEGQKKAALTAYLAEVVRRVGSKQVRAVPSQYHPGDTFDMHPTTPQHAEMARELAPLLRAQVGW